MSPASTADAPASTAESRFLVPREVAERYGVALDKVLGWIRSGELRAVNVATRQGGQPRWRISPSDLALFEASRSSQPSSPRVARARRKKDNDVFEYYR